MRVETDGGPKIGSRQDLAPTSSAYTRPYRRTQGQNVTFTPTYPRPYSSVPPRPTISIPRTQSSAVSSYNCVPGNNNITNTRRSTQEEKASSNITPNLPQENLTRTGQDVSSRTILRVIPKTQSTFEPCSAPKMKVSSQNSTTSKTEDAKSKAKEIPMKESTTKAQDVTFGTSSSLHKNDDSKPYELASSRERLESRTLDEKISNISVTETSVKDTEVSGRNSKSPKPEDGEDSTKDESSVKAQEASSHRNVSDREEKKNKKQEEQNVSSSSSDNSNSKAAMNKIISCIKSLSVRKPKPTPRKLNIPLPEGCEPVESDDEEPDSEVSKTLEKLQTLSLVPKCPDKKEKEKVRTEPYPQVSRSHQSGGCLIANNTSHQYLYPDGGHQQNFLENLRQHLVNNQLPSEIFNEVQESYLTLNQEEQDRLHDVLEIIMKEEPQVAKVSVPSSPLQTMTRIRADSIEHGDVECPGSVDSGIDSTYSLQCSPGSSMASPRSEVSQSPRSVPSSIRTRQIAADSDYDFNTTGLDIPALKRIPFNNNNNFAQWTELSSISDEDFQACDANGDTKLMAAVKTMQPGNINYEKIHNILERIKRIGNGDFLLTVNQDGQSALTLAVIKLKNPLLARLITDYILQMAKKPDNLLDGTKHRLVHILVRCGDELVQVLAEMLHARGNAQELAFSVEDVDENGKTPLLVAAETHSSRRSTISISKLLLARGAQITAQDKEKRTALHLAVKHSCDVNLVRVLLQKLSKQSCAQFISMFDSENRTAFHYAAMRNDLPQKQKEVMELLERFGAKNNTFDVYGRLPKYYKKSTD